MSQSKNNNKTCSKEIKVNSIGGLFFAHTHTHTPAHTQCDAIGITDK